MKSYTVGRNLAAIWSKNSGSDNLLYLDQMANDDYKHICSLKDWPFLTRNRTISTTASTQFTTLPYDCDLVREISVIPTGSTIRYTPRECPDRRTWDQLNLRSYTSDIPEYYFILNGQVGLWPVPASTGNTIYVTQRSRAIDLSFADITSTTVTSITSGATTMVVSGGVTALMAGLWIRVTYTPSSTNTGDGVWYEISGVSGSTITLVRAYGGTTISAGAAACTISQMPLLPEAYHDLPWQWSAGMYWQKEADKRATPFLEMHGTSGQAGQPPTGRIKELINGYSSQSTDMVIDDGTEDKEINPNLLISL
jgi:hypothetical protein